MCVGVVDELSRFFARINGPIDGLSEEVVDLVINGISLLTSLVRMLHARGYS